MEPLIRNISDTALWAATYRARETERHDALFRDPFARRLAGERGERIASEATTPIDTTWAWVMRTYLIDRAIRVRVETGTKTVLNLAAGLDARPYRMDLPESLRWIEVDLPELLAYKEQALAAERPKCALERVALDLTDATARRELFESLAGGLVITEGLLLYLSDEQVAALADDLHSAGFDHWIFELASPALLKFMQASTGRQTAEAGAPMRFAPRQGVGFFERFGWRAVSVESVFETAMALGRIPKEMLEAPPPPPDPDGPIWQGICMVSRIPARSI